MSQTGSSASCPLLPTVTHTSTCSSSVKCCLPACLVEITVVFDFFPTITTPTPIQVGPVGPSAGPLAPTHGHCPSSKSYHLSVWSPFLSSDPSPKWHQNYVSPPCHSFLPSSSVSHAPAPLSTGLSLAFSSLASSTTRPLSALRSSHILLVLTPAQHTSRDTCKKR